MKNIVDVNNLVKLFDPDILALNGISFKVTEGELLGIIGPNGAGKTTLLHILLGLITHTSGDATIFGMDINKYMDKIRPRINFSSTYLSLPISLTVWENLRVSAGLYGIRDHKQRIDNVLDMFDMNDLRNMMTRSLSSGQLSRLFLAKSLINDPEILFLDEPTASLDPEFANRVRSILKEVGKNRTIIFSSHNMAEIEEIADRVIFVHKGKIVAQGSPKDLIDKFKEKDLENVFLEIARNVREEK